MESIGFDFSDRKKGILEFKVLVEAANQEEAFEKVIVEIRRLNRRFQHQLPQIGEPPRPNELAHGFIAILHGIQEPVALVVTLHLFTEQWLNLILAKFCPHFDLTPYTYRRKLEIAFAIGKLNEDLFWNLGKLNALRNRIAHDLAFDLTSLDLNYRGCAEHFDLSEFKPSMDPKAEGNHILNILGLVAEVTFIKLHNHCMRELGFTTDNDKATFWSKTIPVKADASSVST